MANLKEFIEHSGNQLMLLPATAARVKYKNRTLDILLINARAHSHIHTESSERKNHWEKVRKEMKFRFHYSVALCQKIDITDCSMNAKAFIL
jgi:hypothetical protein